MPPLTVARVGPRLVLVGGWHRLAALEAEGIHEAEVQMVEAREEELPWLAAKENLSHGLPLKGPEVREAFRAYVRAKQYLHENGRLGAASSNALSSSGVNKRRCPVRGLVCPIRAEGVSIRKHQPVPWPRG